MMMENYKQKTTGSMSYPKKGSFNRLLFKGLLIWWRMGLGPILSHRSLGGSKMLVLTTWGRKSNMPRNTMLSYVLVDGKEYVCSGWGERSDWYQNLLISPKVTVQIGKKSYSVIARRITGMEEFSSVVKEMFDRGGDSHFKPWLESYGIELTKEDVIAKRNRLYIVGFDKSDGDGPPSMPVDLTWIWGFIVLICMGLWWIIR